MSIFDGQPFDARQSKTEQVNPQKYFGGVTFYDNYYQHSPNDSDLWLLLFERAETINNDLLSALMMIRNTGAQLIANKQFGHIIQPVIGKNGWTSRAEYDRERQVLNRYRSDVIKLLGGLK